MYMCEYYSKNIVYTNIAVIVSCLILTKQESRNGTGVIQTIYAALEFNALLVSNMHVQNVMKMFYL